MRIETINEIDLVIANEVCKYCVSIVSVEAEALWVYLGSSGDAGRLNPISSALSVFLFLLYSFGINGSPIPTSSRIIFVSIFITYLTSRFSTSEYASANAFIYRQRLPAPILSALLESRI